MVFQSRAAADAETPLEAPPMCRTGMPMCILYHKAHLYKRGPATARQNGRLLSTVHLRHLCGALGFDEKRLGLDQLGPLTVILSQQLDPTLDPRLPTLNLGGLRLEDDIAVRRTRYAVVNLQARGHADFIGKGGETGARQTLVQHRGQQASVHDPRMAAQRRPQI